MTLELGLILSGPQVTYLAMDILIHTPHLLQVENGSVSVFLRTRMSTRVGRVMQLTHAQNLSTHQKLKIGSSDAILKKKKEN